MEEKIKQLKEEMQNVHGTPCEVYSRVVGYLRPVQSYNKGKRTEYHMRKKFNVEGK